MLSRAEELQKLVKKAEKGVNLTKEEIQLAASIKPEQVLGVTEAERLKSKFGQRNFNF